MLFYRPPRGIASSPPSTNGRGPISFLTFQSFFNNLNPQK